MTAWLDALLGRFTMYRLVLYSLGILFVVGLVFTTLGVVTPGNAGALGMLASAAVLVVVCLLTSLLFAAIFRLKAHTESTLITAGLLYFILPPNLTLPGLGGAALAGAIAVASKYLLAIRGRHVFNPAAVGAFAIAFTGLSFGAWWPGNPWMLPFVVVLAFLVLFRTRRLPMGAVYVVVGLAVASLNYVLLGLSPLAGLQYAATQSALWFFAAFMITEPLTMPPRRWQQLLYAGLAAVLYFLTFHFGPFYNSPEFALLVVNLLAFLAGQRRGIRLEYVARRQLSPSSWEFDFRPLRPVAFRPGQFLELSLPHGRTDSRGWRRVFSIASAPGELLRFGIRLPEKASSFKRALLDLEPGTRVSATSVGGDFLLPRDAERPLLLVAGGIGITPFIGHLEQAAAEAAAGSPGRDIAVVYAVSSVDDLAYSAQLEGAGCRVALASPEKPPRMPAGWTWIGPDRVTGDSLLAAVPDAASREVFLSGPPSMVAALKKALRRAGARRIHTDVFVGY
ncbi:FAD-dependent oxidoreductase [Pseudolysinimonas sp.]|jgi:ferredoxin-NADP reductase|uniref:FAD-dependent oxidoreductase n=1 Tax=Pseudolysinimonas sp. TaxID=2680009 RepID=UPI003783E72A